MAVRFSTNFKSVSFASAKDDIQSYNNIYIFASGKSVVQRF